MGPLALAQRLGQPVSTARELLRLHRETYRTFWRWSDHTVDLAELRGWIETVLGWRCQVGRGMNVRAVANFPMQATCAEVLRLVCCRATAQGLRIVAPIHDAVMLESPLDHLDADVVALQDIMRTASAQVLG